MGNRFGRWLFPRLNTIPVDRDGPGDPGALKKVLGLIKAGNGLLVFPEGTRSLDGNLQPAQPGIGMIVAKTGATVVPVRISGSYEAFPRGRPFPRRVPISISVGQAMTFKSSDAGDRSFYQKASKRILDAVANNSGSEYVS
jgi:1-acyl-sn-glycerol-3-phosphate acyltransferase